MHNAYLEQASGTNIPHIKQQGGLFKIKAEKRFILLQTMHFLFGLKVMCAIKNNFCHERWGEGEAGLGADGVAGKGNKHKWTKGQSETLNVKHPKQVEMSCHILEVGCEGGEWYY